MRGKNPNEKIAERYGGGECTTGGKWNGQVRLATDRVLTEPLRVKKPQAWAAWNDLFHKDVPHGFIVSVFSYIEAAPWHTFLVLTKRPDRMLYHFRGGLSKKFPVLPNLWLGTTIEGPEAMWRRDVLVDVPAALRFISFEPLLADPGEVDFRGISWCIVGGESGPGARPMHPDWARSLRGQCQAAAVPFFFKQWGPWVPDDFHTVTPSGATPKRVWVHVTTGEAYEHSYPYNCAQMMHVGKKAAGRLLDGRVWDQVPEGKG
jgi:protein gp37